MAFLWTLPHETLGGILSSLDSFTLTFFSILPPYRGTITTPVLSLKLQMIHPLLLYSTKQYIAFHQMCRCFESRHIYGAKTVVGMKLLSFYFYITGQLRMICTECITYLFHLVRTACKATFLQHVPGNTHHFWSVSVAVAKCGHTKYVSPMDFYGFGQISAWLDDMFIALCYELFYSHLYKHH